MVRIAFCRWKVLSDCGRDCNDCRLFHTYCPGCITRVCLIAKCKRGISHIGKHSFFPTDTFVRFEECHCAACNGRMPTQLRDDLRSFTLHNLLLTVGRFR